MKVLSIIPARGGSKGVKDKNIRTLAGKPLIAYAIECAKDSKLVNEIVVSTESETIIEVVKPYNVKIINRPPDLAQDHSPIPPVMIHALQELEKQGQYYDLIILLQVTSPIRTGKDIDNVISMFIDDTNLEGVISVVELNDIHPARMYNIDSEKWMKVLIENGEDLRRQDLTPVFFRNGCIYAIRKGILIDKKTVMPKNKKAYIMPSSHLLNIDSERDVLIGEVMIKLWKEGIL